MSVLDRLLANEAGFIPILEVVNIRDLRRHAGLTPKRVPPWMKKHYKILLRDPTSLKTVQALLCTKQMVKVVQENKIEKGQLIQLDIYYTNPDDKVLHLIKFSQVDNFSTPPPAASTTCASIAASVKISAFNLNSPPPFKMGVKSDSKSMQPQSLLLADYKRPVILTPHVKSVAMTRNNFLRLPHDVIFVILEYVGEEWSFPFSLVNKESLLLVRDKWHHQLKREARLKVACFLQSSSLVMYAVKHLKLDIYGNYPHIGRKRGPISILCAKYGFIETLEWLRHRNPKVEWDEMFSTTAAKHNQLEILKWGRSQNPAVDWDENAYEEAAKYGHLDILKFMSPSHSRWDKGACREAAANGHLTVLKWLREGKEGRPWDIYTSRMCAENGRLDVLMWLREQDPPCPWDDLTFQWAAQNGHVHILDWMQKQTPPCPMHRGAVQSVAQSGNMDTMRWLFKHQTPMTWTTLTTFLAAQYGNLEVLKFCVENGCNWDREGILHLLGNNNNPIPSEIRSWVLSQPHQE